MRQDPPETTAHSMMPPIAFFISLRRLLSRFSFFAAEVSRYVFDDA